MATKRLPRPRDPIQLGKLMVDIATGQVEDSVVDARSEAAILRGRLGGTSGGAARAQKLSASERSDIAKMVNAVKSLPRGWLDKRTGTAFTAWFGGRARRERIQQIREGIGDGSYL